jgi:hypothetical protein
LPNKKTELSKLRSSPAVNQRMATLLYGSKPQKTRALITGHVSFVNVKSARFLINK